MSMNSYYDEQIYEDIHRVALQLGMIAQINAEEFSRKGNTESAKRWRESNRRCDRVIYWALSHHKDKEKAQMYLADYNELVKEHSEVKHEDA